MEILNAKVLASMFIAGANNLDSKKEYINELNVFPVPDGDTGTNMTMTIMSAVNELKKLTDYNMQSVSKAISSGSLRGARGNSGVILSQLIRGFSKAISATNELTSENLAIACEKGVETAYKAVMRPKEGTILTVARGIAEKAAELAKDTIPLEQFLWECLAYGEYVLSKTPDQLPVLKEAGVVDSGGQGLVEVIRGAYLFFCGKEEEIDLLNTSAVEVPAAGNVSKREAISTDDIKFGYCTEFIILLEREFSSEDEIAFKKFLSQIGDSIVCVVDEEVVKIHVHTNTPGNALQKGLEYGELSRIKIDNLWEENREVLGTSKPSYKENIKPVPREKYAMVAVSVGSGLNDLFKEIGCTEIITGGQTMNPSTDDLLQVIENIPADNIFVFPNNKNIILAAQQAKALVEDKNIVIIPTKTIPQGITAILNFDPDSEVSDNESNMNESIQHVQSGEVTYSIRDTSINGREIKKGDYLGIGDAGILANGAELNEVTVDLIRNISEGCSIITVYSGKDVDETTVNDLLEKISAAFPSFEVMNMQGDQPVYHYIVSVE